MTTISFHVNAGEQTGYGHVIRSVALAEELRQRGCRCLFRGNETAIERANLRGFVTAPNHDYQTDVWVVDLEGGCPPDLAQRLRPLCRTLVILNGVGYPDGDPGRLVADLVFYQGETQRPYHLDWSDYDGEWYVGPRWLILRRDFQTERAEPGTHTPPRVVVCGGGADPQNVTQLALDGLQGTKYVVRAIVGPANCRGAGYDPRQVTLVSDPPDMAGTLAWADLAVVSYGMVAFECLALGLPVVALSISPDHAKSAALASRRSGGALYTLGEARHAQPLDVTAAAYGMMAQVRSLSALARAYVDGKGAQRVADKILRTLTDKQ